VTAKARQRQAGGVYGECGKAEETRQETQSGTWYATQEGKPQKEKAPGNTYKAFPGACGYCSV